MHDCRPAVDHPKVRIPPPLIYIVIFLAGFLLQMVRPLPAIWPVSGRIAGAVLLLIGAVISAWSMRLFCRSGTNMLPIKPTTALVAQGPYRFTRNPMYLGVVSAYLGVSLLLLLIWPLVLLPVLIAALNRLVIRQEEEYLEGKFGGEYVNYKARVPRWL
jgi:protein-S-isoprenylcysteine O-methyltransferase Ste14